LPTIGGAPQIGNRPANEEEMRYCLPYLRAQIEIVQPALLVALGSTAAQGLLGFGTFKALGEVRGTWRDFGGTPLLVTYHPSYILRSQSNRSKRMIWEDLLKVMERGGCRSPTNSADIFWKNEAQFSLVSHSDWSSSRRSCAPTTRLSISTCSVPGESAGGQPYAQRQRDIPDVLRNLTYDHIA